MKGFLSIDERFLRLVNNVLNRFFDWRIVIFRKFSYKKWEKVLEVLRRLFLVFIINDLC